MKLTTLFSITQILHLFQNKHTPFKTTKSYNFIPVDYVKSAPQIILFIYVFTFLLFRQLTFRICPKQSLVRSVNSPDIYLQVFSLLINRIYKTTKQRNFIVDRRTIQGRGVQITGECLYSTHNLDPKCQLPQTTLNH